MASSSHQDIIKASREGDVATVKSILEKDSSKVNEKGDSAWVPLHWACYKGNTELLTVLLDNNADIAAKNKFGDLPLHFACWKGFTGPATLLLDKGVDPNAKTNSLSTPLHWACSSGQMEVANVLLERGADGKAANKDGKTPVDIALEKKFPQVAAKLIERLLAADAGSVVLSGPQSKGAAATALVLRQDLNLKDDLGNTLLIWAAIDGCTRLARLLIASTSVDVDALNNENETALVKAVRSCSGEIVQLLLLRGVDWRRSDGSFTEEVLVQFFERCDLSASEAALTTQTHAVWFAMISINGTQAAVQKCVASFPGLASAKDDKGRLAVDIASPSNKQAINALFLWHGRYRLIEPRPEHTSATCFVFKAVDEMELGEEGKRTMRRVALKLMRNKRQFLRESSVRVNALSDDFVVNALCSHPAETASLDDYPETVLLKESSSTAVLSKAAAESLFCLVMPLADRNMYVAMKQERFAGKDFTEIVHVFKELVHAVEHLHSKGIVHADIKPLNIVRIEGKWKLIDFDAACRIGQDPVGFKSSSAYVPPEAVHFDATLGQHTVKSADCPDALTADPSFDVWSLGCILYQLCHPQVLSLFHGGQDDNLTDDPLLEDNLTELATWSNVLKAKKLAAITNSQAGNLLSQLLMRDAAKRPSLQRILSHPFISGKRAARMVGDKPLLDVFLSYRVASDANHALLLYEELSKRGLRVYLDVKCLLDGQPWQEGFCAGLVSSSVFVCLLSGEGINHPEIAWQNFGKLRADSRCDNVLLEHRMALELKSMGMIDRIFPLMIGEIDRYSDPPEYGSYRGPSPQGDVTVAEVEKALCDHLESQGLGSPLVPNRTIASVYKEISGNQGMFIKGKKLEAFGEAVSKIARMVADVNKEREISTVEPGPRETVVGGSGCSEEEAVNVAVAQLKALKMQLQEAEEENSILMTELAAAKHKAETILRFRITCPGLRLPIRANPSMADLPIDFVRHNEEITVYIQIVHGFLRLVDGRGYLNRNTRNVYWMPIEREPLIPELYDSESESRSRRQSFGRNPLYTVQGAEYRRPAWTKHLVRARGSSLAENNRESSSA